MLASVHFGVTRTAEDDWFDTILDVDTELFVDPFLIFTEQDPFWAGSHDELIAHFESAFLLIAEGKSPTSIAYRKAAGLLLFKEPSVSRAGFDGGSDPWFRPRGERAFEDVKSEEVSTGVDRARGSSGA